jgi:hypothetical protein
VQYIDCEEFAGETPVATDVAVCCRVAAAPYPAYKPIWPGANQVLKALIPYRKICGMVQELGDLKVMVVGKDYSARCASPFGSLPAATLSRYARIEP